MEENNFKDDTFLAKWLNGELSESELEEFKSKDSFAEYEKIVAGMKKLKPPEFKAQSALSKVKQAIAEEPKAATQTAKRRRLIPLWGYAAAASIALLISIYFLLPTKDQVYNTAIAETTEISLPDQSRVELNAMSTLTFNSKGWKKERQAQLQGEAFFEVIPGGSFKILQVK